MKQYSQLEMIEYFDKNPTTDNYFIQLVNEKGRHNIDLQFKVFINKDKSSLFTNRHGTNCPMEFIPGSKAIYVLKKDETQELKEEIDGLSSAINILQNTEINKEYDRIEYAITVMLNALAERKADLKYKEENGDLNANRK